MSIGRTISGLIGKINWRLPLLIAVMAWPFVYFTYVAIDQAVAGGIHQKGDLVEVDLKALGNFVFDEHFGDLSGVPLRWRNLDGKRIQLEGFMYDRSSSIRSHDFEFVYNRTICCFSGAPKVQERVFAHVPDGAFPYYNDECRLIGRFHVAVENPTGDSVTSVYTIDVERIEPISSD